MFSDSEVRGAEGSERVVGRKNCYRSGRRSSGGGGSEEDDDFGRCEVRRGVLVLKHNRVDRRGDGGSGSKEHDFGRDDWENGNRDDRLSTLPDDVLIAILDQLNLRDAARTSILSRQWARLPAMVSRLTTSVWDFLPRGMSRAGMKDRAFTRTNAAVVEATKSMLARRDPGGRTIRLLSTEFYLRGDAPTSIGQAVGNAMAAHTIEKAEFTVLTVKERQQCTVDDVVDHGTQFVSFFNGCLNAFAGLTRLYLENLRFAESDFLSSILTTCKQLNYLGFLNCDTESFVTFQIEHAELRELSIVNCRFDKVELKWLPRLTQTTFECWVSFEEPPLSFGHAPSLEVVSLTNVALSWHKMVKLSTLLFETSVRDLRLGFKCEKIWVQPECLTKRLAYVFHLLKIVNLVKIPEGYDLTWTMFIVEAAPSLEELYMTVVDHPCEMQTDKENRRTRLYSDKKGVEWESPISNFKHHRLSKLIIFCFESKGYMVSLVKRVVRAAVNLEDVYLYNRLACRKCIRMKKPTRFPQTEKQRCSTKNLMTEGINSLARIHFLNPAEMSAAHSARILWRFQAIYVIPVGWSTLSKIKGSIRIMLVLYDQCQLFLFDLLL